MALPASCALTRHHPAPEVTPPGVRHEEGRQHGGGRAPALQEQVSGGRAAAGPGAEGPAARPLSLSLISSLFQLRRVQEDGALLHRRPRAGKARPPPPSAGALLPSPRGSPAPAPRSLPRSAVTAPPCSAPAAPAST